MKNLVVRWSELKGEIKKHVEAMLSENDPELISFPYGGRSVRGFIFKYADTSYLIVDNESHSNTSSTIEIPEDVDIENIDEEE